MGRLEQRLLNQIAQVSKEFGLIEPGDRVMVCLSGGKDSYALMSLLHETRRRAPFDFELIGVNLDQGQPGFEQDVIARWCDERGYAHHMVRQDTYSVVLDKVPEGKTYCSLCSRMRRGVLYETAVHLGATKVALGHHRDDAIETLMLNLLYAGQIKAMPPILRSDDGRNTVIRPLLRCAEDDLATYATDQAFPILPCDLCGSQDGLYRKRIKDLLGALEADNPKVKGNLFAALSRVRPSHLLDRALFDFDQLGGDVAEALAAIDGGGAGCALEA